ncbi:MAG: hydantoinase/oxoprolinase family protein [Pseudomonadota bacterium]
MTRIRIGVDVGGTFTDLVAQDLVTGRMWHHKERSTPDHPARAILDGTRHLLETCGKTGADLGFFGHGTTVITNMILERKGARLALVTTVGFRDILDLGRQARPHVYDYRIRRPAALAPRRDRFELDERIGADGAVVTPLDPDAVRRLATTLATEGYDAVAICFLHSYQNPDHEREVAKILRDELGSVYISSSHDVAPEYREFERFATTALNAFVGPRAATYFGDLQAGLDAMGITTPLYTVTSNAGLVDTETVRRVPIRTALSGPAAGVSGVGQILGSLDLGDLVTFDVGGTSTDVAILPAGRARTARTREVAGMPVLAPMVDIDVIGAGGGSIARLDPGGALTVGPESAGALPGPAAYGRGGRDATVTDAALVLGRIKEGAGLGGDMALDRAAAEAAVLRAVGTPLGLPPKAAAQGILDIATAAMARTIRSAALSRGQDVERLCLVAYGGAGPLLGAGVAEALCIGRMVVPVAPGTLCARAILVSDIARDFSRTRLSPLHELRDDSLHDAFAPLRERGANWLAGEGVPPDRQRFECAIECRYQGQNFEIAVPCDPQVDAPCDLRTAFDTLHARTQGFSLPDRAVETVTFRLKARSSSAQDAELTPPAATTPAPAQPDIIRPVFFQDRDLPTTQLLRASLQIGATRDGPAVIEEATSTTIVPPGWTCRVLDDGTLDLTRVFAAAPHPGAPA